MGRVKLLFLLFAFFASNVCFGQNVTIKKTAYLNAKSNGLADSQAWIKFIYTPQGSPLNFQYVTSIEMTRDTLPSGFSGLSLGYVQSSSVSNRETCYFLYDVDSDTVYATAEQYVSKTNTVIGYFDNFGLGSYSQRQAAFAAANGQTNGDPISFTPMVNLSADVLLDVLKPFVTNGFLLGASFILIPFFIRSKILSYRKNLIKAEGRENSALAKDNGLKKKTVEKLRDDYGVLDKKVRRSMSFSDYVGLHKKEFSKEK